MDIWFFLSIFDHDKVNLSEYRNHVIHEVRKRYTIDEFYQYENKLNDMYWNLREKLGNQKCFRKIKYYDESGLKENIKLCISKNHYYRSFINKIIMVDRKNKEIIYRPMEGSSKIFSDNEFNLLTMHILFNKDLYEGIMCDRLSLKDINAPEYYYQYDYPFPNLNCCKRSIYSRKEKMERIKNMYYSDNDWFKLFV